MNYGAKVKAARRFLRLTQADIATNKLSRNLLSNIEMGKTNLIPQKAIMIYERTIELSCFYEKFVDLELDGILKGDERYEAIKVVYHTCFKLKHAVDDHVMLEESEFLSTHSLVDKMDIGIIRFYYFLFLARYYDAKMLKEKACFYYFKALDYLRWQDPEETLMQYEKTLKEATYAANHLNKYHELVGYNYILLERKEAFEIDFNITIYYNLAFYLTQIKSYDKALEYLDLYLSKIKSIANDQRINASLIKASIYFDLEAFDKAVAIYEEILPLCNPNRRLVQRTMVLNNLVHTQARYDLVSHPYEFKMHLEELISLSHEMSQKQELRMTYSNIGLAYLYFEDDAKSYEYTLKALDYSKSQDDLITVLKSNINTLLKVKSFDLIRSKINEINYKELNQNDRLEYKELIISIQKYMLLNEKFMDF